MTTFDEFLRTGRVGSLAVGMPMHSVKELLGAPDDVGASKRPVIWRYGSCQVVFDKNIDSTEMVLESITYYFHHNQHVQELPPKLIAEGWFPSRETTIGEFIEYLGSISVRIVGGNLVGPSEHMVLETPARINYEWGQLWSVSYTNPEEPPPTKQLSVSIPLEQFRMIQREAKARGLSASKLCAQWIGEHASVLTGPTV